MVITHIKGFPHVHVVDDTIDGTEGIVTFKIQVFFPPRYGIRLTVSISECIQIGFIGHLGRSLVFLVHGIAHEIDVPVGITMFIQKPAVRLFDRQVEAPQIAFVLIGSLGLYRL